MNSTARIRRSARLRQEVRDLRVFSGPLRKIGWTQLTVSVGEGRGRLTGR